MVIFQIKLVFVFVGIFVVVKFIMIENEVQYLVFEKYQVCFNGLEKERWEVEIVVCFGYIENSYYFQGGNLFGYDY